MNIGICLGDVAGISPEIVVKALASGKLSPRATYSVIGSPQAFFDACDRLHIDIKPRLITSLSLKEPLEVKGGKVSREASLAAATWIALGAEMCQRGELDALVTAPVNKRGLRLAGVKHAGQTEWLAELTRTKKFAMMLVGGRLRVVLVTTHLPLREVSKAITRKRIVDIITLSHEYLPHFGVKRRRIGIAGLNPHAGDNGLLGDEEKKIIAPAVATARRQGINAVGPLPADTLFYRAHQGEFDAVVAMYHDQGLAPLKMLAFEKGVNVTLGLPFIRTSPDHGTAYDIAGKGIADPSSMIEAINLAVKLARRGRAAHRE